MQLTTGHPSLIPIVLALAMVGCEAPPDTPPTPRGGPPQAQMVLLRDSPRAKLRWTPTGSGSPRELSLCSVLNGILRCAVLWGKEMSVAGRGTRPRAGLGDRRRKMRRMGGGSPLSREGVRQRGVIRLSHHPRAVAVGLARRGSAQRRVRAHLVGSIHEPMSRPASTPSEAHAGRPRTSATCHSRSMKMLSRNRPRPSIENATPAPSTRSAGLAAGSPGRGLRTHQRVVAERPSCWTAARRACRVAQSITASLASQGYR